MPQDGTPRQSQALQPETPEQDGSQSHSNFVTEPEAFPEQVFAGECGDPIWEGRRPGEARVAKTPRPTSDEHVPAGRIIDLVQGRAPEQARTTGTRD